MTEFVLSGDIFWDVDYTEDSATDPDDILDNVGRGTIVRFEQAKRLPDFYGVCDDKECYYFETLEEAEAKLAEIEKVKS